MPLNNHNAYPTADTFHGMRIHKKMTLQWSAEENIIFYAHIARHQLQSLSTDHHLPDVYKRLRIGRFVASEGYVSVVLPSISQAIKSRMRILNENEDTRPFLQGVVHGTRIRFYPAFMDAWAKPGWIGDMKKPRSEEAAEDDDDHTVSSERTEPMPTPPVPPALGDNAPLVPSERTGRMPASSLPPARPRPQEAKQHRRDTAHREWWKSPLAWDLVAEQGSAPDNLTPPITPRPAGEGGFATTSSRAPLSPPSIPSRQAAAGPAANPLPVRRSPPRPPLSLMGVDPPLLAVGKKRLLEEYRAALCELVKVQLRSRMVKLDTAAGRIVHMSEMERSAVRERERATRWRATQLDRSLSDADLPSGVGLGLLGDLLRIGMY